MPKPTNPFEEIMSRFAPALYETLPTICLYCGKPRNDSGEGWHENCAPSRDAKARIEQKIEDIKRTAERPFSAPQTSEQMRKREDRRHELATALQVQGLGVKEDYRG